VHLFRHERRFQRRNQGCRVAAVSVDLGVECGALVSPVFSKDLRDPRPVVLDFATALCLPTIATGRCRTLPNAIHAKPPGEAHARQQAESAGDSERGMRMGVSDVQTAAPDAAQRGDARQEQKPDARSGGPRLPDRPVAGCERHAQDQADKLTDSTTSEEQDDPQRGVERWEPELERRQQIGTSLDFVAAIRSCSAGTASCCRR